MPKVFLIAALLGSFLLSVPRGDSGAGQEKTGGATTPVAASKVTITTGGGLYGPVKNQFKVGETVPVVISLTNTSDKPLKYCMSTFGFQNRPQLTKDGQPVSYVTHQPKLFEEAELIQRCETSPVRQFYQIQPQDKTVIDWFTLNQGSTGWFGNLPAGRYELVLQRRIVCCQGPFVESDKITFEIVP